ncbi:MAG: NADH-quinone oxidoreductase subunit A [Terriglobales bacterium]
MPDNYFARYIPLLIQFGVALVLATGMVLASSLLGKHRYTRAKFTPYECGMTPVGDSRERFSVKFYLVAMLFILFDVEAVFLYPWAIIFKDLKVFGFVEMMVYIAILLVGLWYVWKKGVLDWAERPSASRNREILDLRRPTLSPAAAPPDPIVEGTKV